METISIIAYTFSFILISTRQIYLSIAIAMLASFEEHVQLLNDKKRRKSLQDKKINIIIIRILCVYSSSEESTRRRINRYDEFKNIFKH